LDIADLENRFAYHPADAPTGEQHDHVRQICLSAALDFNDRVPEGREKSLAITRLEEAMMWANAAIARQPKAEMSQRV